MRIFVLLGLLLGATVAQAEVCRFAAGDPADPFARWLSSQAVTCAPTAEALQFPAGLWNVFARDAASVSMEPLLVDGDRLPAELPLSVVPGARLAVTLGAGQAGVIYLPRRASALPVEGPGVLVPADEPLWLIVLEKKLPVAVLTVPPLAAGTERAVDPRQSDSAILGWLQLSAENRTALGNARGVSAPQVSVGDATSEPLPSLTVLPGSFVLVRGVTAGEPEVEVTGRGWLPQRQQVKVRDALTVLRSPLLLRPSSALLVRWSSAQDLVKLHQSIGGCGADDDKVPRVEITVSACPTSERRGASADPSECRAVRQESFAPDLDFGSVTLDEIAPGTYRAEMRFGNLPLIARTVRTVPFQQASTSLQAYYSDLYGSLTLGGQPLRKDATIKLPGGAGFAREETEEYRAVIEDPLEVDAKIDVSTCDGRFKASVYTDRPVRSRSRFDLDVPDNALIFKITDTFTGMRLDGASVRIAIHGLRNPDAVLDESMHSADDGDVSFRHLPEREISATISHAGYQKYRVPRFTMPRSEEKTIEVQLVPLRGTPGRIISPKPFEEGTLFWFAPGGEETERADLAPDGTFVYDRQHEAGETMAVVSRSHPLWVLRTTSAVRGASLEVRFPDAPSRTFEISLADGDRQISRVIGILVRGLRVPSGALHLHQSLRKLPDVLRGPGPLVVRDLAETGPIDVILGPDVNEVPARVYDPLALPRYADAPRKRLEPGATGVKFE